MKIFLTGEPRCGKSTIMIKIIDKLKTGGLTVGGFIAPEIRINENRQGFKVVDIYSREEGILAKICENVKNLPKVSKYCVDVDDFERVAIKALDFAVNKSDVICVDEIGTMELFSKKFKKKIEDILESEKDVIAVLHRDYIDKYGKYGKVISVTSKNRDELPDKIMKIINGPTQN